MATKALAIEWGAMGSPVNAWRRTFVYTPGAAPDPGRPDSAAPKSGSKIPVGRLATTDDIAAAVAYLASPAGPMINGQRPFPWMVAGPRSRSTSTTAPERERDDLAAAGETDTAELISRIESLDLNWGHGDGN